MTLRGDDSDVITCGDEGVELGVLAQLVTQRVDGVRLVATTHSTRLAEPLTRLARELKQ